MKDVVRTLCERHDLPEFSVLAEQNGQLFYTAILFTRRQEEGTSISTQTALKRPIYYTYT